MPPRRLAAAAAAVVALTTTSAVSAAPCRPILTDKTSDAYAGPAQAGAGNTPPVDIKHVDVGTGRKTLVLVLTLATTKASESPLTAIGYSWQAQFDIAGTTHRFVRQVDRDGRVTDNAYAGAASIAGVAVKVDATSIRWTVPRAQVAKLAKGRPVLTAFMAKTASAFSIAADRAPESGTSSAKYVDLSRSCARAS